jgi:hypothetical protein
LKNIKVRDHLAGSIKKIGIRECEGVNWIHWLKISSSGQLLFIFECIKGGDLLTIQETIFSRKTVCTKMFVFKSIT